MSDEKPDPFADPTPTHHLPAALAKIAHGALATLGVIAHLLDDPAVLAAIDPKYRPYAVALAAVTHDVNSSTP